MNLLERAQQQYVIIRRRTQHFAFQASPADPGGRLLEFYPRGEEDSFDPAHYAIETFGDTVRVIDVAGDIASHFLAFGGDLVITDYYRRFIGSLTVPQHARLHEQYDYAVANDGEERPFATWARLVGMPAYFRGLPFQQGWPASIYTGGQRKLLQAMMLYLRTGRHA